MTVKELIEALRAFPTDHPVAFHDADDGDIEIGECDVMNVSLDWGERRVEAVMLHGVGCGCAFHIRKRQAGEAKACP